MPHFEKMLYDNAQMITLYSRAYKAFQDPFYERVVRESTEFMARELLDESGGFYSSLDADSEGEEGAYYVWTPEEIEDLLSAEEAVVCRAYYRVESGGNFEGKTIMTARRSLQEVAEMSHLSEAAVEKNLARAREKLFEAREKRVRPRLDDKVITAWNAWAVVGYCEAYEAFGTKEYLAQALRTGYFIRNRLWQEPEGLNRIYKDGPRYHIGLLGRLCYYRVGVYQAIRMHFDEVWLEEAHRLKAYMLAHFLDRERRFFFYAPHASDALIARKIETDGGVIPAPNAVAAQVLAALGHYYESKEDVAHAAHMVNRMRETAWQAPYFYSAWVRACLRQEQPVTQVAIVGTEALARKEALSKHSLVPVSYVGCQREEACTLPLLKNKWRNGETLFYVCKDRACRCPSLK